MVLVLLLLLEKEVNNNNKIKRSVSEKKLKVNKIKEYNNKVIKNMLKNEIQMNNNYLKLESKEREKQRYIEYLKRYKNKELV